MNVQFHYYTIYHLAMHAGFDADSCRVIAYSSQYLDNALVSYRVELPGGAYQTLATHHFGFWERSQELDVWIPFHFLPAGPDEPGSPRRDGQRNPLNVVPNSRNAKQLLVDALKSRDLYRIGIALHTYADSWAHQNFSGRNEEWNRVDPSSPLPPIGHAQALRDPDSLDARWEDPRLLAPHDRVDNRARFLAAAGRIYRYLATYNRRGFEDEALVVSRLDDLLGRPEAGDEARTADFVIECGMDEYSRLEWRREAFEPEGGWNALYAETSLESTVDKLHWLKSELVKRTALLATHPVRPRGEFRSTHLYRWDQAARAQRERALRIIGQV